LKNEPGIENALNTALPTPGPILDYIKVEDVVRQINLEISTKTKSESSSENEREQPAVSESTENPKIEQTPNENPATSEQNTPTEVGREKNEGSSLSTPMDIDTESAPERQPEPKMEVDHSCPKRAILKMSIFCFFLEKRQRFFS
jgi:hypothetical protein